MLNRITVAQGDISRVETDAAIVNLFENVSVPGGATGAVDSALMGLISELIRDGEFSGKLGESVLIHTPSIAYPRFTPSRVLVMGLGKSESFDLQAIRTVSATAVNRLSGICQTAASIVHGAGVGGIDPESAALALAEGAVIGSYSFDKYKSSQNSKGRKLEELKIVEFDGEKLSAIARGAEQGMLHGKSQNLARDLVNEPANVLSPEAMAGIAVETAEMGAIEARVMDLEECRSMGMNAFAGVAQGSSRPAKFVHLIYRGDAGAPQNNIWLIGKSITFDSGGLSLKPPRSMVSMKSDMGGGAAVVGTMRIIAETKPRINVHAVLPITENMPGGSAQRPGDVVRAMSGKFIEIDNTDAEGRLTIADAIGYARAQDAARIIDVATLTGAARIALGNGTSAVFGNDGDLIDQVLRAARESGDEMWRLPLDDVSKRQNRSKIADLKNSGGSPAGSITAAHFIADFAEDVPWVHIDIAATSMTNETRGMYRTAGATGEPTRTLARLIASLGKR